MEAGTIRVDQGEGGDGANSSKDTSGPRNWTAVNGRRDSDSTSIVKVRESNAIAVNMQEPVYTTPEGCDHSRISPPSILYNSTLDSNRALGDIRVEIGESNDVTVDAIGQSDNAKLDASDHRLVEALRGLDSAVTAVPMDALGEVDAAFESDGMHLDVSEAKCGGGIEVRGYEAPNAASSLQTVSHYIPQTSEGLRSWLVVEKPTCQDGQQGWDSKWTKIDPKELLEQWDWVFQR
jgi:hypothetical protein